MIYDINASVSEESTLSPCFCYKSSNMVTQESVISTCILIVGVSKNRIKILVPNKAPAGGIADMSLLDEFYK